MSDFMPSPCKQCPFRTDVTPYLHPDRAAEIAYSAQNPYSSFPCHKTTVNDEEYGGEGLEMIETNDSKQCAGFLTLRAQMGEHIPKGFVPAWELCYLDEWDMIEAYQEQWDKERS